MGRKCTNWLKIIGIAVFAFFAFYPHCVKAQQPLPYVPNTGNIGENLCQNVMAGGECFNNVGYDQCQNAGWSYCVGNWGYDNCENSKYNNECGFNVGADECNSGNSFDCWSNYGADQCNGNTNCFVNYGADNCNANDTSSWNSCYNNYGALNCDSGGTTYNYGGGSATNCSNNYGVDDNAGYEECVWNGWEYVCSDRNFFGAANTGVSCNGGNGSWPGAFESCENNQNVWVDGSDYGSPGSISDQCYNGWFTGYCGTAVDTALWAAGTVGGIAIGVLSDYCFDAYSGQLTSLCLWGYQQAEGAEGAVWTDACGSNPYAISCADGYESMVWSDACGSNPDAGSCTNGWADYAEGLAWQGACGTAPDASTCLYAYCPPCSTITPGNIQTILNNAPGYAGGVAGQSGDFVTGAVGLAQSAAGQFIDPTNPADPNTLTGEILGDLKNADVPAVESDVSNEASLLLNTDLPGLWSDIQAYYVGIIGDTNQVLGWLGLPSVPSALDNPPPYPTYWASWPPGWWPPGVPWPFQTAASTQPVKQVQATAAGVLQ